MQQEGKDEVPVDVFTVHWVRMYQTAVFTEFCHTVKEKKKTDYYVVRFALCVASGRWTHMVWNTGQVKLLVLRQESRSTGTSGRKGISLTLNQSLMKSGSSR